MIRDRRKIALDTRLKKWATRKHFANEQRAFERKFAFENIDVESKNWENRKIYREIYNL